MRTYGPLLCLLFLFAVSSSASEEDYSQNEEELIRLPRVRSRPRPRPRPTIPGPQSSSCPTIVFKCQLMARVCANMKNAIRRGKPTKLNRITNEKDIRANRRKSGCVAMKAKKPSSCDEYPFASTRQGGTGSVILKVPLSENNRQGGQLRTFYKRKNIRNGGCFKVRV